jgi:2-amino-4-hydroxy-6-hydroxymethyldihydropteridine diphosphokinase
MATVFIGLGTNLGERERNLAEARRLLGSSVRLTAESTVIETEPWGYQDQADFLNQVVTGETDLTPEDLLKELKSIENRMGRAPSFRYGPRLIDLDLLYYDDLVQDQPDLTIPHPHLHLREFVLRPLAEVDPDWVHPVLKQTHRELLLALEDGDSPNRRILDNMSS